MTIHLPWVDMIRQFRNTSQTDTDCVNALLEYGENEERRITEMMEKDIIENKRIISYRKAHPMNIEATK
mgnify:FL=1